jgi:hypothetical protein
MQHGTVNNGLQSLNIWVVRFGDGIDFLAKAAKANKAEGGPFGAGVIVQPATL